MVVTKHQPTIGKKVAFLSKEMGLGHGLLLPEAPVCLLQFIKSEVGTFARISLKEVSHVGSTSLYTIVKMLCWSLGCPPHCCGHTQ